MRIALDIALRLVVGLLLSLQFACVQNDVPFGEETFVDAEITELDWKIETALVEVRGEPRLQFIQSFKMPREKIILRLPDTFLRKERLFQRIEHLSVSDNAHLSPYQRLESVRILEAPIGSRVELSYLYRPDDPISYAVAKETFSAPIIRGDYFQFVGLMALIYPNALINAKPFSLTLEWRLPKSFNAYNSYGAKIERQKVTTDFDRLRDAFFVAGSNLRETVVNVRNQPVTITFEGSWDRIPDEDFVNAISRVIAKQREIFNDDKFPYFFVNLLSVDDDCTSNIKFAGTAHPNSFRAFFPNGEDCNFSPEMKHLIAHELMHMWIGKKIKVGKERGHIDGKWFTEGWTDYFGRISAYRAGVLTEEEYFQTLNRQLEKYYVSSERMVTLKGLVDRMYKRGQSNRALEDVPYQQGELMAMLINKDIKLASQFTRSLDDVIKQMLVIAENAGGSKNFTFEEIDDIVGNYASRTFRDSFSKIIHGRTLLPPQLGNCRAPKASNYTRFLKVAQRQPETIYYYGKSALTCERWLK